MPHAYAPRMRAARKHVAHEIQLRYTRRRRADGTLFCRRRAIRCGVLRGHAQHRNMPRHGASRYAYGAPQEEIYVTYAAVHAMMLDEVSAAPQRHHTMPRAICVRATRAAGTQSYATSVAATRRVETDRQMRTPFNAFCSMPVIPHTPLYVVQREMPGLKNISRVLSAMMMMVTTQRPRH